MIVAIVLVFIPILFVLWLSHGRQWFWFRKTRKHIRSLPESARKAHNRQSKK